MAYKDKEKQKEYKKAWRQAHREEQKAYRKAYYKAHREECNAYHKAYNQAHKEEKKAYQNAYHKAWYKEHKEEQKAYHNAYMKEYIKEDTNSLEQPKQSIRVKSSYYLFNVLKHTKLEGYEIHHCFGYEDHRNFIYIPKELHLQIHQFLRDNGISADTDHYNQIAQLIINYIKCNEKHILILKQSQ